MTSGELDTSIVDAQVHVYPAAVPDAAPIPGPVEASGETLTAAMDEAGVDAALLVPWWPLRRGDISYASGVFGSYPDRFRIVAPLDPTGPRSADLVATWAETPGVVGLRMLVAQTGLDPTDPTVRRTMESAERAGFATCVFCTGKLSIIDGLARAYPRNEFVLDHLGLPQALRPPVPSNAFDDLDAVVALAEHPNVHIKITGACTMSQRPFPFDDLWEPVGRLIEAFGVERSMWGTDWTRALDLVSYPDSVAAFRDHWPLSAADLSDLMGGTLRRVFRWPDDGACAGQ